VRLRGAAEVEESTLVERARGGDRGAFEALVRRHADRLHAVILRFMGSAQEAEEVTQETFLRAWRGVRSFEGHSQFFTWLYRIGVNEAKRRADRTAAAATVASLEDEQIEDAPDWSRGPETEAEAGELRGVLEAAIRSLPADYRAPLILRDVEGFSTREAAEIMGLGEAAFKSRLHRARLAVRGAVDRYYLEERAG
jgi:RNA polymerase sigma-70 factor (ECF subfamily)